MAGSFDAHLGEGGDEPVFLTFSRGFLGGLYGLIATIARDHASVLHLVAHVDFLFKLEVF